MILWMKDSFLFIECDGLFISKRVDMPNYYNNYFDDKEEKWIRIITARITLAY